MTVAASCSPPPVVFTIGHSTRGFQEVMGLLAGAGVDLLADIRSYPGSRTNPQWARQAIIDSLPAGLEYRWLKRLGGRRHTPAGIESPNDGWRVKAFRDYADYMASEQFAEGIDELLQLASAQAADGRARSVAIMCSEAVPWRCHRRLVTDALLVRGVQVRHIMSATSVTDGTLTPFAQVDGTRLTYPRDA